MDGMINIYKEQGWTSHNVVAKLRGILHTKKIGHTGTLDPMAEGVLPVCIGNATKLCESFTDHDKEYEAAMILGVTYDTLDVTGTVQEERKVMSTKEDIEAAVRSFIGGYEQVPPMYSAKKVGGKKLYDLARSGMVIERKGIFVNIYDIEILSVDIPHVKIRVKCGKGTYIRSLIDDIGKKLGCGAAMEELVRTKVGEFTADKAHTIADVQKASDEGKIADDIIGLEDIFAELTAITVTKDISKLLRNGNLIDAQAVRGIIGEEDMKIAEGTRFRMYDSNGTFTGIYEYKTSRDILKPYKMFT